MIVECKNLNPVRNFWEKIELLMKKKFFFKSYGVLEFFKIWASKTYPQK